MDITFFKQGNFVEITRLQVFSQQEKTVIWPQWQLKQGVSPAPARNQPIKRRYSLSMEHVQATADDSLFSQTLFVI